MPIRTIPKVKVSGFPYAVLSMNMQAGLDKGPNRFSVKFIDEDGRYSTPNLSTSSTSTINIKGFKSYSVHPISYQVEQSESGCIMTVDFVDRSIILDKINVGLYKRHGLKSSKWLKIVGEEVDPCSDNLNSNPSDPCNPCKDNENQTTNRLVECLEAKENQVLDIRYNLNTLLKEMGVGYTGISPNPEYYAAYTGTLREVLQRWAADYGYTFFWDGKAVKFVNLTKGIAINDSGLKNSTCLIAQNNGESLEGSYMESTIVNYLADGEKKEYDCDSDSGKKVLLFPVRLNDIIPDGSGSDSGGAGNQGESDGGEQDKPAAIITDYYGNLERMQAMCAMAKYSENLRDNYYWFINEDTAIIDAEVLEQEFAEKKKKIGLLGDLEPKKVFYSGSLNRTHRGMYNILLKSIGNKEEQEEFERKGGYFFSALQDEELLNKFREMEKTLADDFLGRYWVRKFGDIWGDTNFNISVPDGNAEYYQRGDSEVQFPFLNALPGGATEKTSSFIKDLVDPTTEESADNFILLKREPYWLPSESSDEVIKIIKDMDAYVLTKMGKTDIGGRLIGKDEEIFYAFEKPSDFEIGDFKRDTHPKEADRTHIPINILGYKTHYGLRSAQTEYFTVQTENVKNGIKIYLPTQSGIHRETGITRRPGYIAIIQQNSSFRTTINVPKIEMLFSDLNFGDVMSHRINLKDATQFLNSFMQGLNEIETSCLPKSGEILRYLERFARGLGNKSYNKSETASYTIAGLPPNPKDFDDGLVGFNIAYSNGGLQSTLQFSSLQPSYPSDDLILHRLEEMFSRTNRKEKLLSKLQNNRAAEIASH